jgi:hypothetical protein
MSAVEAVTALDGVCRDEELAMLDELVERARLGWKCRAGGEERPCHYMNIGEPRCGACGAPESEGKEVPDG